MILKGGQEERADMLKRGVPQVAREERVNFLVHAIQEVYVIGRQSVVEHNTLRVMKIIPEEVLRLLLFKEGVRDKRVPRGNDGYVCLIKRLAEKAEVKNQSFYIFSISEFAPQAGLLVVKHGGVAH